MIQAKKKGLGPKTRPRLGPKAKAYGNGPVPRLEPICFRCGKEGHVSSERTSDRQLGAKKEHESVPIQPEW